MTCVIGYLEKNGNIVMGSDSIGVSDYDWLLLKTPKIFIKGEMIFGYSSSIRFGQILQHSFFPPKHMIHQSDIEYVCSSFMEELIKVFEKVDFKKDDKDEDGWNFLLGYHGKLYTIQSNFQVVEDLQNYASVGCGSPYAKGVLYALEDNKSLLPEERILKALEAASQFSMVKAPFHLLKLELTDSNKQQEIFLNQ